MTSERKVEANRRNARKSTGPITQEGKQRSRCNAVRHGLTAETVIGALEDSEDYKAFEAAITADYDIQSAVERVRCSGPAGRTRSVAAQHSRASGTLPSGGHCARSVSLQRHHDHLRGAVDGRSGGDATG